MPAEQDEFTIIKHAPDARPPVYYSGRKIDSPPGWFVVRAAWLHGDMDLGYLEFRNGDYLDEYFALNDDFNLFALYRADGEFVGWYCNVADPATVCNKTLHWHDLYVDVIVYPDLTTRVVDEDELAEAGIEQQDPDVYRRIIAARDELLRRAAAVEYPFSTAQSRPA